MTALDDAPDLQKWSEALAKPADWTASLPDAEDWTEEFLQAYDDQPTFGAEDTEVDTQIRLNGDRRMVRTPTRRLYVDYRANPDAYRHLDPLPARGETLHGIISGKYALWELIPAVIERMGQPIAELTIATLSFNRQNAADILSMLDDGHIRKMSMLISYYFKSTSRPVYDSLIPQLRERGQKVLAMRTHCKILLAKMADATTYVVESSANLRSSVNIEQFTMTADDELYQFHFDWMHNELLNGKELGGD